MESINLRHIQGTVSISDDVITIERNTFSGPSTTRISSEQIVAIRHTLKMMGGALSISLQLSDATTIDLKLVTPVPSAQQFIAVVEADLAARTVGTPAIAVGAPDLAESGQVTPAIPTAPAAPVIPQPQIVVVTAPPSASEQMIKIYGGPDCAKHFQKEAKRLARKGWRVQSQTYGGQASKAAAVLLLGPLGFATKGKPSEMTVVYVRG